MILFKNIYPFIALSYTKFIDIVIDKYGLKYTIYFSKAYLHNTLLEYLFWVLLGWLLLRWLLPTFNFNKTLLGETGCLGTPYFLLTGCLGIQLF